MALTEATLRCVHSSNPNRVWVYGTDDTVATVVASGYFNNATEELRKGDVILASTDEDGTPDMTTVVVTSATGAATVTTAKTA